MDLAADTVADRLRSEATSAAALGALEALAPPIQSAVALSPRRRLRWTRWRWRRKGRLTIGAGCC